MMGWLTPIRAIRGITLIFLLHALIPLARAQYSLEVADQAFFRFELDRARAAYEEVWEDATARIGDRVRAGQSLARIIARIEGNLTASRNLLTELVDLPSDQDSSWLLIAQIELEAHNYEASRRASERAIAAGKTPFQINEARTAWSRVVLEQAIDARLGRGATFPNSRVIRKAHERIVEVLNDEGGAPVATETGIGLSLVVGDGPRCLDYWRTYYRVEHSDEVPTVLRSASKTLHALLPSWNGTVLTTQQRRELISALSDSRLFRFAAALALQDPPMTTEPEIAELVAYQEFLDRLAEQSIDYYREKAAGQGSEASFRATVDNEFRSLWRRLNGSEGYSYDRFQQLIERRFGAQIKFQSANGHFGLHFGHSVVDEQLRIEQYGETAIMRFVSLDFMVSNGYSSWFWGNAEVGGWVDRDAGLVVQIRRPYLKGVRAWRSIMDPQTRKKKYEDVIARNGDLDDATARDNPHAFLPGLAARIELGRRQVLKARLEAQGLSGVPLRLAFIRTMEEYGFQYSIVAHEGRHALDSNDFSNYFRSGAEREFRAKLSEIALAPDPFMALGGGILAPNIGDGTTHGQANERIMRGLVDWMDEHREEIAELNHQRPLLPQLHRLTTDQLRMAAKSMDPMAQ